MSYKMCKYYKSGQQCTFDGNCAEQLLSDKNRCNSFIYLAMDLAEQLQAEKQNVKNYKQALEAIKERVEHYFTYPIEFRDRHIFEANMEYIEEALEVLNAEHN